MTTDTTTSATPDANGWALVVYSDDERGLGPDDHDLWEMTAASELDRRADNRYGDGRWEVRDRSYTWSRTARKWIARAAYRVKPAPDVIDLARLSVDLDNAAGAVHALTRSDVEDLRSLAGKLERVAAALDGDTTIQLVPYPWS